MGVRSQFNGEDPQKWFGVGDLTNFFGGSFFAQKVAENAEEISENFLPQVAEGEISDEQIMAQLVDFTEMENEEVMLAEIQKVYGWDKQEFLA